MPTGTEIAGYSTYLQAQQAVDYLAEQHFPVEQLTILGTDLRSVERVTGRLTHGRVAVAGAMSGAWFGLFVGLLLSLFGGAGVADGVLPIAIALGAGFGLLFSVLSYTFTRGRRDFTSHSQTVAGRYAVLCRGDEVAFEARRLLLSSPVGIGDPAPAPPAAPAVVILDQPTLVEQPRFVEQPPLPVPPPPPPGYSQPVGAPAQPAPTPAVVTAAQPLASGVVPPPTSSAAPAKEPDSRWTLPNGMPRYGALASEVEVQAAVARTAQPKAPASATTVGQPQAPAPATAVGQPEQLAQAVVVGQGAPNGSDPSESTPQTGPPAQLGQGVVVEPPGLPQPAAPNLPPTDSNQATPE